MSSEPNKRFIRTSLALILGVGAGAASLFYLRKRSQCKRTTRDNDTVAGRTSPAPLPVLKPQPGDILLFHNARGLNKLITGFTGSPFYHVALYAGSGHTVEARTSGVVRQNLRGRENDYVVAPAPEGKGKAALAWAETKVGDAYDNLDIGVIILDRLCRFIQFNYTQNDKYSCGEFVAVAFDKAGAHLFPKNDLSNVVPGDFARFVPAQERQQAR